MTRNISDIIEQYLKKSLQASQSGTIEIQRSELAELFGCVPSQINYVISTRFTLEKGYLVESKRGGGGYIRIKKIKLNEGSPLRQTVLNMFGAHISQREAEGLIHRLYDDGMISLREMRMIQAAIQRDVLLVSYPERDALRARILAAMLMSIL
ncbi:transcriptional regulator [Collibacillus ludicampi]|jgi:transcriptional regulator CtsR|uniref:Transcriptional regulator CtsR n=1 Tax=Collibacillus ludicampi TaxID=2771369 RepID=A0AAV4LE28_9BACL|nr:CtsR family transcriptional regulator [Collibacillus ludicampi]GIM46087.1 transcriptional regulator [Collibacillus ludicampi]